MESNGGASYEVCANKRPAKQNAIAAPHAARKSKRISLMSPLSRRRATETRRLRGKTILCVSASLRLVSLVKSSVGATSCRGELEHFIMRRIECVAAAPRKYRVATDDE